MGYSIYCFNVVDVYEVYVEIINMVFFYLVVYWFDYEFVEYSLFWCCFVVVGICIREGIISLLMIIIIGNKLVKNWFFCLVCVVVYDIYDYVNVIIVKGFYYLFEFWDVNLVVVRINWIVVFRNIVVEWVVVLVVLIIFFLGFINWVMVENGNEVNVCDV